MRPWHVRARSSPPDRPRRWRGGWRCGLANGMPTCSGYVWRAGRSRPSPASWGCFLRTRGEVFERDGILLAVSEYAQPVNGERSAVEWVRYRTVGDLTITGAVRSTATDIERVIAEISAATVSERGETRADDRTLAAAMEDRKREGYF